MFVVVIVEDKVKISPEQFDQDNTDMILVEIGMKYINKVLVNVGLCISFYDMLEVGDPYIYPAEGSSHQRVKFRLVVFRPFIGEVLTGRVSSCRDDGIRVSMDFFEDITIPSYLLQAPSEYDTKTKSWQWNFEDSTEGNLVMRTGDRIRFRVRTVNFTHVTSTAKGRVATTNTEAASMATVNTNSIPAEPTRKRSTSVDLSQEEESPSAMQIIGCVNEDGLGLIDWW